MRINRPKPITQAPIQGTLGYVVVVSPIQLYDCYDYILSSSRTGRDADIYNQDSDWQTAIDLTNTAGTLTWLMVAGKNSENATNDLHVRLTIDGVVALEDYINVPANGGSGDFQAGIQISGRITTHRSTNRIQGVSLGMLPFSDSLKVEVRTSDHVNMPVAVSLGYHLSEKNSNRPSPPFWV